MARSDPQQFPTALPLEARVPDGLAIYVVGDVHGRADLLKLLIDQIRSDRAGTQDRAELILLGDYIDRGPDSGAVIDQIIDLQGAPDFSVTALKGNHESIALQFLADPTVGHFWCGIGGRATLLSYGVRPPAGFGDMEHWEATRQAFRAALPATHLHFLQRLTTYAERGDYVFVHAGLRPRVRLSEQREWDMLWIRNEFLNYRGYFEKVVVHGHTPEDQPFFGPNRIGIDTGAGATNRLTGLKLVGAERQIFSADRAPIRFPRATERRMCQAARSLSAKPSPPVLPELPSAPEAGVATAPWWRGKSVQARIAAALPAGLVALVAIGYLAVPPADRETFGRPTGAGPPENEQPGDTRGIDDIIARADKALNAATRGLATQDVNVANSTTIVPAAPVVASVPSALPSASGNGAAVSGARNPDPGRPASVAAQQSPDRRVPETRAAMVTPSPKGASGTTGAAAQAASHAVAADRTAAARGAPALKPASSDGGRSAPNRAAAPEAVNHPKELSPPKDARLAQGTASAARDVMQTPSDEGTQGFSPAQSAPATAYTASAPIKNANRIGSFDYLDASIRADEQGVVGVRYVVDTGGRVSSCSAVVSSSFERLDKRTCELIVRRFRFKPAIRNGKPVQEVREQRIRWTLSE